MFPAAEFHGMWENLVYDIEIKQRVSPAILSCVIIHFKHKSYPGAYCTYLCNPFGWSCCWSAALMLPTNQTSFCSCSQEDNVCLLFVMVSYNNHSLS